MKSRENIKICIVLSTFDNTISDALLNGATQRFIQFGGLKENITLIKVPGAFEIPGTIAQVLKNHSPHAIVAIGAVIRGETPHFDFIAGESSRGISELSRNSDIPIINGIITTNTVQHALDRSQPEGKNKGWEAMETALQTISVYNSMRTDSTC